MCALCAVGDLSLGAIIGIAAGGAGLILLIVLFVLLLVCVYMCARSSSKGGESLVSACGLSSCVCLRAHTHAQITTCHIMSRQGSKFSQ